MWCFMVLTVVALMQNAQGGYEYPKPTVRFELPNEALQNIGGEVLKANNIDKTTVSYSLPHNDYRYLHQNEKEHILNIGQNAIESAISQGSSLTESNPINAQPVLSVNQLILNIENKLPPLVNLQNSEHSPNIKENDGLELLNIQNIQRGLEVQNNVPSLANLNINQVQSLTENTLSQSIKHQDESQLQQNSGYAQYLQPSPPNINNVIKSIEIPILNLREAEVNTHSSAQSISSDLSGQISNFQDNQIFLPNINVEQASLDYQRAQAAITEEINLQNNQPNELSSQSLNTANIETPVVTKSVYFHVPPPDLEQTPVVPTALPPKKIYKIIFIKTPTQNQNLYNQQLQTALYSNLAPVEQNTIIYVLSKKPEALPEQVVLPQPTKVSEHEVLYVQYNSDQKTDEGEIDGSISQAPLNSANNVATESRVLNGY